MQNKIKASGSGTTHKRQSIGEPPFATNFTEFIGYLEYCDEETYMISAFMLFIIKTQASIKYTIRNHKTCCLLSYQRIY